MNFHSVKDRLTTAILHLIFWPLAAVFLVGAIYILFFQQKSEPRRLSPAEFNRLQKIYGDYEKDDFYPSDPYRLAP